MDPVELRNRFAYHPPKTPERSEDHQKIRSECSIFAGMLDHVLPEGREKSLAMTKLEEVMFWANAAIARQGGE